MRIDHHIRLDIDDHVLNDLIYRVLESLPEASLSLRCRSWNYQACEFRFEDEEGLRWDLNLSAARRGFRLMIGQALDGKFGGCGWSVGPFFSWLASGDQNYIDTWLGMWDAPIIDQFILLSLFGEVHHA